MAEVKRILCLANSFKTGGRCIAGMEYPVIGKRTWIRPASDSPTGEVHEYQIQLQDGNLPEVLDVIDIPLIGPKPVHHQKENWLIDAHGKWKKAAQETWHACERLVESPNRIWLNGFESSHGHNDRVPGSYAAVLTNSLYLIQVDSLKVAKCETCDASGAPRHRIQGHFDYHDESYSMWITDTLYNDFFNSITGTEHDLGPCYLTISLGEEFNGFCYKLIAAIILVDKRPGK